jgi:two-component system nitrate/nitrite response regulator NarL
MEKTPRLQHFVGSGHVASPRGSDPGFFMQELRILVVDDHEIVRRGISSLLEAHAGWVVCGHAGDGVEAIDQTHKLLPDIIIMDVTMPTMNGLQATRVLCQRQPESMVIVLSQHDSKEMMGEALSAGARAFVRKSSAARDLVDTIERLTRRESGPREAPPQARSVAKG